MRVPLFSAMCAVILSLAALAAAPSPSAAQYEGCYFCDEYDYGTYECLTCIAWHPSGPTPIVMGINCTQPHCNACSIDEQCIAGLAQVPAGTLVTAASDVVLIDGTVTILQPCELAEAAETEQQTLLSRRRSGLGAQPDHVNQ